MSIPGLQERFGSTGRYAEKVSTATESHVSLLMSNHLGFIVV